MSSNPTRYNGDNITQIVISGLQPELRITNKDAQTRYLISDLYTFFTVLVIFIKKKKKVVDHIIPQWMVTPD